MFRLRSVRNTVIAPARTGGDNCNGRTVMAIDHTISGIRSGFIRFGRDSSVSIATRYGLEDPGIESRWGEIFRTYPDRLRGPPSLRTMGTGSLLGVKAAGA